MKKCKATTLKNKPCSNNAKDGSDYCGIKSHQEKTIIPSIPPLKERFSSLSNFNSLLKLPSKWYALAYFFCVPIFGLIYYNIPNHFYHTTARFEKEYYSLADSLANQLVSEFEHFGNLHPEVLERRRPELINPDLFKYSQLIETKAKLNSVANFQVIGNRLQFDLLIHVSQLIKEDISTKNGINYKAPITISFFIHPTVSFDVFWSNSYFSASGTPRKIMNEVLDTFSGKVSPESSLTFKLEKQIYFEIDKFNDSGFILPVNHDLQFKSLIFNENDMKFVEEPFYIYMSPESYKNANTLFSILKGFPFEMKGGFLRYLYLSATTLTTLGLGDIYPLTAWARFWIIIETLLGILIIGLFLNSLANENSISSK